MSLTKREEIAAMALAGLLANPAYKFHGSMAALAVQQADDLIKLLDVEVDDWGT